MESRRLLRAKKRRLRKVSIFAAIFFLTSILAMVGTLGYQSSSASYHTDVALAHEGMQHLRTAATLLETLAQHPFDTGSVSRAQQEFSTAQIAFTRLEGDLKALPEVSTFVPVYGTRLNAALHLVPAAQELARTGTFGCAILTLLIERLRASLSTAGRGLSMSDMMEMDQRFHQGVLVLDQAINEVHQVRPDDVQFDPTIARTLALFQNALPSLQVWLSDVEKLLPVVPALLGIGAPTKYLVEILDSTELRPAGGFIGNYGIATFLGGRLTTARITDVDLLDGPFEASGHRIPYPPAYQWFSTYLAGASWSFRDSGLDADFPTAARSGELNYIREGGDASVQGVIAITPGFIQRVLTITGPIAVPEYQETVTAQSLISRIHYHQLGGRAAGEGSDRIPSPDGHSSLRKRFTELLAEHLFAHLQRNSSTISPEFVPLVIDSLRAKDMQIYFNSGSAEAVLQQLHLDGAIRAPAGDGLLIVDANVSPNKANSFITNVVHDQVIIDESGNAIHHTTIVYAWTLPGRDYGRPVYRDYVSVYTPLGSILSEQGGWQPQGTTTAHGAQVWMGFFTLVSGQTHTITLVWASHGVAKRVAKAWQYQYLLQRQTGIQRSLNVQVQLPACETVTDRWGGFGPGSTSANTSGKAWNEDMNIGLDYQGC